jgi:hypothetical protein
MPYGMPFDWINMSFSSPECNAAGEFGRHARVLASTGTPDLPNWWNRELRITYSLTAADELQLQVRCARMSHIHLAFNTPFVTMGSFPGCCRC